MADDDEEIHHSAFSGRNLMRIGGLVNAIGEIAIIKHMPKSDAMRIDCEKNASSFIKATILTMPMYVDFDNDNIAVEV